LLHGDLWKNNYLADGEGEAVLIDIDGLIDSDGAT